MMAPVASVSASNALLPPVREITVPHSPGPANSYTSVGSPLKTAATFPKLIVIGKDGIVISYRTTRSRTTNEFLLMRGLIGFSAFTFTVYMAIAPDLGLQRTGVGEITAAATGLLIAVLLYSLRYFSRSK
jgi:hypothetical protein